MTSLRRAVVQSVRRTSENISQSLTRREEAVASVWGDVIVRAFSWVSSLVAFRRFAVRSVLVWA